ESDTGKPAAWSLSRNLITAAAFTSDGKTLVTYSRPAAPARFGLPEKRLIEHWQAGADKPLRQFEIDVRRPEASTEFPFLTADARFLLHVNGAEVVVWDALTGKVHARVKEKLDYWAPFALSGDGKSLALRRPLQRTNENELVIYDLPAVKERCRIFREGYSH